MNVVQEVDEVILTEMIPSFYDTWLFLLWPETYFCGILIRKTELDENGEFQGI